MNEHNHTADETKDRNKIVQIKAKNVSGNISSRPSKLIRTDHYSMEIQTATYV